MILSRVRTLKGLFFLTKLEEDYRKYMPRKNVMKEMSRLRRMEKLTIDRIHSISQVQSNKKKMLIIIYVYLFQLIFEKFFKISFFNVKRTIL